MKSEFALAFNEITERFSLPRDTVMEALEAAMVSAYRRSVNASSAQTVEVKINPETGEFQVFAEKEVVEEVENPSTEVSIDEAHQVEPEAELGGVVMVESTPADFGRVAAQTAKQVILQRLREAEREAQYAEFIEREGDMVHGTVHSITPQAVTVGLLGRAEAILPRNQQIPGERFRVRDRIRVYVLEVRKSSRGPVIVVSRTHPAMLRRLLEMEVPEINQGHVEIKAIAREAGKRAKVAVAALRDGVDPVGACVGLRGVRIQSVVRDLNDEKIDVIEWSPESESFIAKALSPARVSGVYLDDDLDRGRTAMVVVPEDQLSLAIGRSGVNARLAAKLTGWRIDIKSLPEAAGDSIKLLQSEVEFVDIAEGEKEAIETVEAILTKKAENRPITPEEYQLVRNFVDRVQMEVVSRRLATRQAKLERLEEVRSTFPTTAYDVALEEIGLSTRVHNLLTEAGYQTAGKLLEQLGMNSEDILNLSGIGPKAMVEIQEKLDGYEYPEPEVMVEEEVEEVEELEPEVVAEPVLVDEAVEVAEEEEVVTVIEQLEELEPIVAGEIEAEVEEPKIEERIELKPEVELGEPMTALEAAFRAAVDELDSAAEFEEEVEEGDEEEEELFPTTKRQKKRKKRVVEYDPESGEMIVTRRRKRQQDDWEDAEY
ncbi:MAG: transcription termination/antitermination protein NusA [Anaerolineales bacterium]|nr:transcription termination/antitermination protein NusA [Anaerolineales bacterium]